MPSVTLQNVSLVYPVYDQDSRSFSRSTLTAIGGTLRRRGNVTQIRALNRVSFELRDGDRLGILGPNGSGKTTLLNVLAGIYKPTSGEIMMEGKIDSMLGLTVGMDPEESAIQNIFLRGTLMGLSRKDISKRLDEILEFADLGVFSSLPIRTYSSGMQMRLAFSIATAINPEILLMDEWLSVGDEAFKLKARERLQNLVDQSKILVIATHDTDTLTRLCSKVLWLDHGNVVEFGNAHDVVTKYKKEGKS